MYILTRAFVSLCLSGQLQKGLPEDATIDSVEAVFSQFGAVARIIIFRERETKKAKGEACVEFETEEGSKAAAAAAKLDLDGREISITPKKEHKEKAARDHKEKRDKREKTEEELQQEAEAAEERKKAKEERIERMKGTVLHVTFTGEEGQEFSSDFNKWDVKALFEEIVSTENIRFVDFAAKNAWVRMTSPEPAQKVHLHPLALAPWHACAWFYVYARSPIIVAHL
jgi:RNA recognition motif-containing protein